MALLAKFDIEKAMDDVAAAVQCDRCFRNVKKVGVVGYCLGGTLAWLGASRLPIHVAVGYYGGRISQYLGEQPKVPMMLHFGELDAHIPQSRDRRDREGASQGAEFTVTPPATPSIAKAAPAIALLVPGGRGSGRLPF